MLQPENHTRGHRIPATFCPCDTFREVQRAEPCATSRRGKMAKKIALHELKIIKTHTQGYVEATCPSVMNLLHFRVWVCTQCDCRCYISNRHVPATCPLVCTIHEFLTATWRCNINLRHVPSYAASLSDV